MQEYHWLMSGATPAELTYWERTDQLYATAPMKVCVDDTNSDGRWTISIPFPKLISGTF